MWFGLKWSEVAQSCPTLCDPMDCSLQGSSIHRIFQARMLEWVAISFSRGSSWPRDWTWVFHIAGRCFTVWATKEAVIWLSAVLIIALVLTNSLVILAGWFLLTDFKDHIISWIGTSLAVQWLRLCTSTAGDMHSMPGRGTKISHATQCGLNK